MRRTLLIASTYLPPISGGAEQVAWELAKKLADDFEVHIITTSGGFLKKDMSIHYVSRLPLMPLSYSTVLRFKVKKILEAISPDIIHVHMALPWGYILHNANSTKVVTCHGSDTFPEKRYPERFFLDSALSHADILTAPSRWLIKYIEEKYGRPGTTIPNGVDTNTFRPMPGLPRRDDVVLFVGRFLKLKGVLDLVEAARALPKYEFWLVGSAEGGKNAIQIPRLPNVKIVGFMPDKRTMAMHYNRATICAFPSHRENFPLVGLEAMACGKAVVATKRGFSEYIDNGLEGLLVEPHDIKGLIGSIRYLMENKAEREKLERNAKKKASLYDWEMVAREYKALYEKEMALSQ